MPIVIETRIQWKKRTKKICDSNLSLASIDNPVEHRQTTLCVCGLRESMRVMNKVLKMAHLNHISV